MRRDSEALTPLWYDRAQGRAIVRRYLQRAATAEGVETWEHGERLWCAPPLLWPFLCCVRALAAAGLPRVKWGGGLVSIDQPTRFSLRAHAPLPRARNSTAWYPPVAAASAIGSGAVLQVRCCPLLHA